MASYTDKNPNGRLPTIIDHKNNDFTIWESGAILLYLVGKYDKEHKISFSEFDTIATANQYLMFQMSGEEPFPPIREASWANIFKGQGPYFGQAVWFNKYHAEKIPSAIDRYDAEIRRVLGVLEVILADKEYLVENRVSYVDLAFVPWNWLLKWLPNSLEWEKDFPKVAEWDGRLNARESVKKARELRADALKA